jgi:hypothetical protein
VFFIFKPVTCVLTTQLLTFTAPVCPLTVLLVNRPHSFVLVAIF